MLQFCFVTTKSFLAPDYAPIRQILVLLTLSGAGAMLPASLRDVDSNFALYQALHLVYPALPLVLLIVLRAVSALLLTRLVGGKLVAGIALVVGTLIAPPIMALAVTIVVLGIMRALQSRRTRPQLSEMPVIPILGAISATAVMLHWPWVLALPGVIALLWAGIAALSPRAAWLSVMGVAALLAFVAVFAMPHPDVAAAQQAGMWLADHSALDDVIAANTHGVNSALAYFSDRHIQVINADLLDHDYFALNMPSVIVLLPDAAVGWDGFKTTYAHTLEGQKLAGYQRAVAVTPLIEHSADLEMDANLGRHDLRLVGFAVADQARAGDLMRIRFDWQFAAAPSFDLLVQITLVDHAGKIVGRTDDTIARDHLSAGRLSTAHLLSIGGNVPPGAYTLHLAAYIRDGLLGTFDLLPITVSSN